MDVWKSESKIGDSEYQTRSRCPDPRLALRGPPGIRLLVRTKITSVGVKK